MMTDRELMSKALDALELWEDALTDPSADHVMRYRSFGEDAAKALRERLSQPEPEPVAWLDTDGFPWSKEGVACRSVQDTYTPLYTYPPQRTWVGLTDKEILEIPFLELVEGIQAKLKEKNT